MIYYLIILLFFLFGIISLTTISKYTQLLLIFFSFFFLLVIGGLRYQVGADWDSYYTIYHNIERGPILELGIEPLFGLIIVFFQTLGLSYSFFVFTIFFIATTIKFKFIINYSTSIFGALLIYLPIQFMSYDINGIRQGLALALVLFSFKHILNQHFIKFAVTVGAAAAIHYSAILFFPCYFFANRSFKPFIVHSLIAGSILLGFLFRKAAISYIQNNLTGLESAYAGKIAGYSESEAFGQGISLGFSTFHRLGIFYLFYTLYDKIQLPEKVKRVLLNTYLFSLIIYFLFSSIEIIAARGSLYYRSFDIIMISSFITIPSKFSYKCIIMLLLAFYSFWGAYTNLKLPDNGLVPYKNLLFIGYGNDN